MYLVFYQIRKSVWKRISGRADRKINIIGLSNETFVSPALFGLPAIQFVLNRSRSIPCYTVIVHATNKFPTPQCI